MAWDGLGSRRIAWDGLGSPEPGIAWDRLGDRLGSLGWVRLGSLGVAWHRWGSPGIAWDRRGSLRIAWDRLGSPGRLGSLGKLPCLHPAVPGTPRVRYIFVLGLLWQAASAEQFRNKHLAILEQVVGRTVESKQIVANTSAQNVPIPGSIFCTKVQVPWGAAVARRMASSIYIYIVIPPLAGGAGACWDQFAGPAGS